MKRIIYSIFAVFTLACFALAQQVPDSVSISVITTFDYPGTGTGNSTFPQKINDTNDIVGGYVDSSGVTRGFVRFSNGTFSPPIVDPNDTCIFHYTLASGINNSRLICGDYHGHGVPCFADSHGFFLMGHTFSNFDVPGSGTTTLGGVNNVGDFAGSFRDRLYVFGFVSIGGIITSFSVPGTNNTFAYQLNSLNQLEGYYVDTSDILHGYWRDSNGALHFPIDAPGSTGTSLFGNNDSNWMVGSYVDSAGTTHGLFFVPPNKFLTFDYPGSTFTSLNGINAQGFICGHYTDASGINHGILAVVMPTPTPTASPTATPTPTAAATATATATPTPTATPRPTPTPRARPTPPPNL